MEGILIGYSRIPPEEKHFGKQKLPKFELLTS